jgi:hypothetical protein
MVITLLTDFGMRDATVAMAKAALLHTLPDAAIADITHNVPLYNQREAAQILSAAWPFYPQGTVHIVNVAPFVGKTPALVIARHEGHFFIAPDNGLLPLLLPEKATQNARAYARYSKPYSLEKWMQDAAQLAQSISTITILPYEKITLQTLKPMLPVQLTPTGADCRIMRADRYGNVTLNISRAEFETLTRGKEFSIETMKGVPITSVSRQYNDVPREQPLCRFNREGLLEIAVNHGSAASMLELDTTDTAKLYYSVVRIRV